MVPDGDSDEPGVQGGFSVTDKLSQAILLLRQATDIQLEAHKLISEFHEAYGSLSGKDGGVDSAPLNVRTAAPVSANPPPVSTGSIPPRRSGGGDSFLSNQDGMCKLCGNAYYERDPIVRYYWPGDGWPSYGHPVCVADWKAKR